VTCDDETVPGLFALLMLVLAVTIPVIPFAIMWGLDVHSDIRAGVWCNHFGCYQDGLMVEPINLHRFLK